MRDRPGARGALAIVRATLRELAPLLFGALAIGLLLALSELRSLQIDVGDRWNTWPMCVLPVAALWGGLAITGSRATLVHLLARPIARVHLLGWRLALLLVGLAVVAVPLWLIGRHQFANSPSLATIATATVLAAVFGAQGATLSEREPTALAGALMFGAALMLPVQMTLDADQLTWARVHHTLGWWFVVPLAIATALLVVPVVLSWRRSLPVRSIDSGTRTVLASLSATLVLVFLVVRPTLGWLSAPERGELLTVVAATSDGVIVATGTLGRDSERAVVDGLVSISDDGERSVLWNRREEAPDGTVWKISVPEVSMGSMGSVFDDMLVLDVVDGVHIEPNQSRDAVEIHTEVVADQPDRVLLGEAHREHGEHCCDVVFGNESGHRLAIRGNVVSTIAPGQRTFHHLQTLATSEIPLQRWTGVAVARGRIWGITPDGSLWSSRLPWGGAP